MKIERTSGYKISNGKIYSTRLEAATEEGKLNILQFIRGGFPSGAHFTTEQIATLILNRLPELNKIHSTINTEIKRAQTSNSKIHKSKIVGKSNRKS